MAKYKIVGQDKDQIRVVNDDGSTTTFNQTSWQYEQFVADVVGIGTSCVEGADVITTTSYDQARASEYPPIEDQLDKIYHSGVDAWKADIKAIKDKYPKSQVGVVTTSVPDWVIDLTI